MSNFEDGSYGSLAGIALIGKVLAGHGQIHYTRAAVGKGTIPEGMTPKTMDGPPEYVMDAKISSVTNPVDGECQVTVQVRSDDVETGFYITSIVLYAEDPDEGEVPYTYLYLENEPEWIRPASSIVGKFATFDLIAAVGDVDTVSAIIDPEAIATVGWVNRELTEQIDGLQGKMNEYFGNADNPDGGIEFIEGIEAKNVVEAINEVFQLGNEKKNKLVENLVAMGVPASTEETWEELLNKVLDMTDTSKDTVTAGVLIDGYTAHDAAGELITGIIPERAGMTVDTTGVTQDSSYTYFAMPTGHYDENSKVRAINSDLSSGVYYIGTGTNFDLKSKFPDDYSKFTTDNFIVVPTVNAGTSGNQGQYTGGYGQTYYASNTKLSLTKTYTNGVISIIASLKITASATSRSYDVDYPRSKDYSPSISCAVYLVVGEIKNL